MKQWNESEWFRNWLDIARQGQNSMRRAEGHDEVPLPLMERQASRPGESLSVDSPQWQVSE